MTAQLTTERWKHFTSDVVRLKAARSIKMNKYNQECLEQGTMAAALHDCVYILDFFFLLKDGVKAKKMWEQMLL